MEQLATNQSSLDKNWLREICPELNELPREMKYKDGKEKELIINSNQISIIVFDWLSKCFFDQKKDQAIDAKLLSERWGRDERGSYRLQDKVYFVYGKIHCFQEESLNIAKDKDGHRWFIQKIQFPEERFKEEFISKFRSMPFGTEKYFAIDRIKKAIKKDIFEDKYPDYIHKPIADFFFE